MNTEGIASGYATLFAKQADLERGLAGSTPAPSAQCCQMIASQISSHGKTGARITNTAIRMVLTNWCMMVEEYIVKKGSKHQNRLCAYCHGRMTPGRKFVLDPECFEGHLPKIFHTHCRVAWLKRGKKSLPG
jgi:hypothetical protein